MMAAVPDTSHYQQRRVHYTFGLEEEEQLPSYGARRPPPHNTTTTRRQRQQHPPHPKQFTRVQRSAEDSDKTLELTLVGHSRAPDARVYIRIADLDAREAEMQQAARQFHIPPDRWAGSLLYRQYYDHGLEQLRLDPEHDCIERNYSYAMQWEDWLTTLLVQYYETGRLNIPDACQGSDLLLLLEYFGILYAPDQLIFASYAAYQRVRAWSDYLTQRVNLADHVVHVLSLVPSRAVRVYQLGTVESPSEKLTLLPQRGETAPIYSWGCDVSDLLSQSHLQPQSLPTSRVIFNLFNMTKENKVAEALRDDFGVYLQNLLPAHASDVTFSVKMVQVQATPGAEHFRGKRAVLKLTVEPLRTKSEISHPVDEVTANRQSPDLTSSRPPLPPGKVSVDHVYQELDRTRSPNHDIKTPSKLSQQRSLDPVMAGKTDDFNAPIDVVEPFDSATITSALTGPFNGGDSALGEEDVRAEALRQEWMQGSLLNRDIDHRMKALLENAETNELQRLEQPSPIAEQVEEESQPKPREPGTPETAPSEASDSPAASSPQDKGCVPWEWVNFVCGGFYDNKPSPVRLVPLWEPKVESKYPDTATKSERTESTPPSQAQVVATALAAPAEVPTPPPPPEESHPVPTPAEKITTHEGVKQRLAELRVVQEIQNNVSTRQQGQARRGKNKSAPEVSKTSKQAATKPPPDAPPSLSKKNGFFRNRQVKVVTRKVTKKPSTVHAPTAKKVATPSAKKTTGLRKLFRRGND